MCAGKGRRNSKRYQMIKVIRYKNRANLRSSKCCEDVVGFERKKGKKTRGIKTAKQPTTIAKTTVGRERSDILQKKGTGSIV